MGSHCSVRGLLASAAAGNFPPFHHLDGEGYRLFQGFILSIEGQSPPLLQILI
jgi:hypothetical protein